MVAAVILFCFLYASFAIARKIDADARALPLIILLSSMLLAVEMLSALNLFRTLPLLTLALLYGGYGFFTIKRSRHAWQMPTRSDNRRAPASHEAGRWMQQFLLVSPLFLAVALFSLLCPVAEIDSVAYHLPIASELVRTGSAWHVFQAGFVGPNTYFPANHEALQAFLMLAVGSTHLNALITLLGVLLLFLALSTLGRNRVPDALTFVIFLGVLSVPFISKELLSFQVDTFLFCLLGSALAFLASTILQKRPMDALQCFLALGLALGTKYNALTLCVLLLPFFLWLAHRLKGGPKEWWWLPCMTLLTGGFWYGRNWLLTGNPLYPFSVRVLGWEGHMKILADMTGTSLWHAIRQSGIRTTAHAVLANSHFSSELGNASLALFPCTLLVAAVAWAVHCSAWRTRRNNREGAVTAIDGQSLILLPALLLLALGAGVAYITSPYTFTLWNEVVRYSAGLMAVIPVLLLISASLSPRIAGTGAFLCTAVIAIDNLVFRSFLFDPVFLTQVRDRATSLPPGTLPLIVALLVMPAAAIVVLSQCRRPATVIPVTAVIAVCVSLLASVAPAATVSDDAFLARELTGYARLLPALTILRQEKGMNRSTALAGLTPYWIFEKEGWRALYVNVDGCDACTYPDYRNDPASIRAHPNEDRWKQLMTQRNVGALLIDSHARNATGPLEEEVWAKRDPGMFQPLLASDGIALYRVRSP